MTAVHVCLALPTYNVAKSYRSLSLTSILGKIYERIAVSRLQHFMQSNGLYDQYQYAYQQNRNITQAIMFFSLNVLKGFKEGKDTLAAFIDLAGAFDNVWRQGLIFKLYEAGLRGRLFMYVVSYLTGRTVHSKVNNHTTESIPTYIGVPQGSVISPLLFIFYIREMTYSLERRISYADDLTAWVTSDHNTAVAQLKPQLETTMDWCHKWRQDVNLDKTVILLFTRGPSVNIHLQVRNHTLNQVDSIRCLGFELDSKLQFNQHINKVTSSALGAVGKLGPILYHASSRLGLHIYKTLVRPHLERTYPVWCCSNHTNVRKVERAHRAAMMRATRAFTSTSTETLEILTNTPPIHGGVDRGVAHPHPSPPLPSPPTPCTLTPHPLNPHPPTSDVHHPPTLLSKSGDDHNS